MGWRFQRRMRLLPGLRLNLSKSGASLSIGHRGFWYTIGPRHSRRLTVGLPGSGLYWTERYAHHPKAYPGLPPPLDAEAAPPPHAGHRLAFVVVVLLALIALAALAGSAHAAERATIDDISRKGVITLDNGDSYRTDDDVSGWNPGDEVVVPDSRDKLINGREEVDVEPN